MTQKRAKKPGRGRRGAPDIWWWEARGQWYTTLRGKQHKLGKEEQAARIKFAELLLEQPTAQPVQPPTPAAEVTALEVCDRFLKWSKAHKKTPTFKWHNHFLQSWFESIPSRLKAVDVRPHHVQSWVDARGWKDTTANRAISVVQRAFSWGEQQGLLETNRIRRMQKPSMKRHEVALTAKQIKPLILEASTEALKTAIRTLAATGMRPKEFRHLEIRHLDPPNRRAVLQWSEGKGERIRVIYFSRDAWKIVRKAAGKRKEGAVFLNSRGKPWTMNALRTAFYRLGIAAKVAKLKPGTMRHSFATNALAGGMDALTVSLLMGHSDPSTIARQYQHLTQRPDVLRKAIEKADKGPK